MKSIELFAGAGGLGMGMSKAGFEHDAVIEWNSNACETMRRNKNLGQPLVADWPILECDVTRYNFKQHDGQIEVISGGPPCQPFSLAGKHRGFLDHRDMFPQAIRAVREIKPRAFVFENVKGLTRPLFHKYLQYIILHLEFPDHITHNDEPWESHLKRLERFKTSSHPEGLRYNIVSEVLNASDFGIPQKRERLFIVGFRADLNAEWSFPAKTHSEDALLRSKWITGEYWEKHGISRKPKLPVSSKMRIKQLSKQSADMFFAPWQTVRDALAGLPDPKNELGFCGILNHIYQPGAKPYVGHTGSDIDEPAKTLKAGDHGVPGGENMLRLRNNKVRYFTIRESARLQTFPDDYQFFGSWSESMRQLGNAVPVALAEKVFSSVAWKLRSIKRDATCVKNAKAS